MKIAKAILIALGIVLLTALPLQGVSAYGGVWGPCARLADPLYSGAFGPFGPSPGQIRACQRRVWKYGPPPWAMPPPRPVTPVIVLRTPAK
ncbi:MAG: hypothetical protein QNJ87_07385 [Gammaproteobacteria bacterium]|nr:hypothetical protein [Gammaproteobacteria bacterium]